MIIRKLITLFKYVYSKHKKTIKRKRLISKTKTECFKLRYKLLNLCIQYTYNGLKQGRFLYRIQTTTRQLHRRELYLKKIKSL
jgi:hypothetical protein